MKNVSITKQKLKVVLLGEEEVLQDCDTDDPEKHAKTKKEQEQEKGKHPSKASEEQFVTLPKEQLLVAIKFLMRHGEEHTFVIKWKHREMANAWILNLKTIP